jgi:hypothetical protein
LCQKKMNRYWIKLIANLPFAETTVLFDRGQVEAKRGRPRNLLLAELKSLATANGIEDACIHATGYGKTGFKLYFTGIPKELHQRFRNVWGANWK